MTMEFNVTFEMLVQRVGMTLLYSLGIGLVLALLTGFILVCTRNKKAVLRYNLLTALLCAFVLSVGIVFYQISLPEAEHSLLPHSTLQRYGAGQGNDLITIREAQDQALKIGDFFWKNMQTITLVWLLVVVFKTVQMARSIYDLHYLKRNKIYPVGSDWEGAVAVLAGKLGLRRQVRLLQSGLVKIPIVMGHFKPVILIPLGAITNIPADEIEMILLHELAHIKRADFLVNIIQQCAELLFFFNPAVLWVSALIRTERENCCDDIAIAHSCNRKGYIQALLSFSSYQDSDSVYAMAFTREDGLLDRVRRIAFGKKERVLKFPEKVFLVVAIVLMSSFTMLLARVSVEQNGDESKQKVFVEYIKERLENKGRREVEDQHLELNEVVTAETMDHSSSAESNISRGSLLELEREHLGSPGQVSDTLPQHREMKTIYPGQPLDLRFANSLLSLQKMLSARRQDSARTGDSLARFNNGARYGNYANYFGNKPGEYDKELSLRTLHIEHHELFYNQVMDEIEKAGVKYDRNRSSIHLSDKELIVDGIRQPVGVHLLVISKFLKNPGDKLDFIFDVNTKQ